jgi:hypothetical protein
MNSEITRKSRYRTGIYKARQRLTQASGPPDDCELARTLLPRPLWLIHWRTKKEWAPEFHTKFVFIHCTLSLFYSSVISLRGNIVTSLSVGPRHRYGC